MNVKHYLFIAGGAVAALTALNYAVGNITALNTSKNVTSINALLQNLNPLYYVGAVAVPAIPAT